LLQYWSCNKYINIICDLCNKIYKRVLWKLFFIKLHITFWSSFLYAWIVVLLCGCVMKCVVCLVCVTVLIICFWWHLFIITLSYLFIIFIYFLVYLLSCMYILLVFSQKIFEWETFPQIKFGDASLGIPVWFHSFNMACPGISVIYNII